MELKEFLYLIKRKKQTIFSITLLVLAISMAMTFVQPLKYSSTSKIMVVQKFSAGTDPYVTAKSNEYLSNVLSEVINSNSFFIQVMDAGFDIDKTYFEGSANEQMKLWEDTVTARPNAATGMIELEVYHKNKWQAEKIANAIHCTLINKHDVYHGSGAEVMVKVINQPILSKYPVKPNVVFSLTMAIALAIVISLTYIYLLPEREYDIRLWPSRKRRIYSGEKDWLADNVAPEEKNWEAEALRQYQERRMPDVQPMTEEPETEEYRTGVKREFNRNYNNYKNKTRKGSMNNVFGQSNYGN